MRVSFTAEEIERWRDRVHRRTPRLAIRTKAQAIRFIDDVGFCFAFKADHSELPCLWHAACGERHPTMPRHTHHDPFLSFVWEMKRVLPAEGKIYYGRLFRRRPTMISLEYLPEFYALSERSGRADDYILDYRKERLTPMAKEIMDSLRSSSPQVTRGLRIAVGCLSGSGGKEFEKAMTELQTKFYIVKVAEHYDPFTFEWNTVDRVYAAHVRKARRIRPETARKRILQKYFENQLVSSVRNIQSLFRWRKQTVYETLGHLMKNGTITNGVTIDGKATKYYCLVA